MGRPTYAKPTDAPLTRGRWYLDTDDHDPPRSWALPTTPLYHTQATCGLKDIPIIHVPEDAKVVELVIQNLSPTAHVLHMHGMPFKVINVANFTSWCGLDKPDCFVLPWWDPTTVLDKCPRAQRRPGDRRHKNVEAGGFWGCTYNASTDKETQDLETPLVKDTFQLWQRSWAVLRFRADRPGFWYFHCHGARSALPSS